MFSLRNVLRKPNFFSRIMSYYAVAKGHEPGIYDSWAKCEEQVKGFKGAKYKKFKSKDEAHEFMKVNGVSLVKHVPPSGYFQLGKKGDPVQVVETENKNEDYWPESDGDNLDWGDEDLLAAVESAENGDLKSASGNSKKRKLPASADSSKYSKVPKHESIIWEPVGVEKIGAHSYQIDSEGYVICYTDGSCFNNGRENACAGYGVFFEDNHPLNAAKPVKGRVTNNAGEIQAAIHAIKTAKTQGIKKICISTDSQFLINAITMWIRAWKFKGWRLKNGDPVKNVDDFKELDDLVSSKDILVKWNYVKGHKGIKGNEEADRLARQGTEMYKKIHKIN